MSNTSRRRLIMAAGAALAGAAIPLAAASNAWADGYYIDISYDGKTIIDTFPNDHSMFMADDAGTAALSGTNNDYAVVIGTQQDDVVGLANDSFINDTGDGAIYDGIGETSAPVNVFGLEGAAVVDASNSNADVYGGGTAIITEIEENSVTTAVSNSAAVAYNGGFAMVDNDETGQGIPVTYDFAEAIGTVTNTGAATQTLGTGTTPSIAGVYGGGYSEALADNTGSNPDTGYGGAAVQLANNSDAYAVNEGSSSYVGDGVTTTANDFNYVNDGMLHMLDMPNMAQIDGIPDATFLIDLLGGGGATAFTTAWTDLLQLF